MNRTGNFDLSLFDDIDIINQTHRVYLVKHSETQNYYVKKVLDVYNAAIYEYLKNHVIPGVPRVYACFEKNGQLTVIEELITGSLLSERIEDGTLTASEVSDYMVKLCRILEKLHSVDPPVIHRDIKPSNIIIDGHDRVYLLDFNASKFYNADASSDTMLLGTMGYAAPEQYGFAQSSQRTDIYSLGKVLEALAAAVPGCPDYSVQIKKCTAMDPEERYHTVADLRFAIAGRTGNPVYEKGSSARNHGKRRLLKVPGFRSRNPWKMTAAVAAYLLMISVGIRYDAGSLPPAAGVLAKIYLILVMFLMVYCGFNYSDFRFSRPFVKDQKPWLKAVGICLAEAAIFFLAILAAVLAEDLLHLMSG
jgi:serine/threonine protein kinase